MFLVFFQVEGDSPFIFNLFLECDTQRVPFERHTKERVFGTLRTEVYRRYATPVLPVADIRQVRYDIKTATGYFDRFATTSIPVLDTSGSSARLRYPYLTVP